MESYCIYCYGLKCPNKVCLNCNEPDYDIEEENE